MALLLLSLSLFQIGWYPAKIRAFQQARKASTPSRRNQFRLSSVTDNVRQLYPVDPLTDLSIAYHNMILERFPGSLSNADLLLRVASLLQEFDYTDFNTLVGTSLCGDETARRLEDEFVQVYQTNNFSLGGLSGFPFAGTTGFVNMCQHIPDAGQCLLVFGPHVGVSRDGTVGQVERKGVRSIEPCCASAIAACRFVLEDRPNGGAAPFDAFADMQQSAVQQLLMPQANRLAAAPDPLVELPYTLFELQDEYLEQIVLENCPKVPRTIALLGGIQVHTAPDTVDFFCPLRFDILDNRGEVVENMLDALKT